MRIIERLILIVAITMAVAGSVALCAHAYDMVRAETVRVWRTG